MAATFLAHFTRYVSCATVPHGCLAVTHLAAVNTYPFGIGIRFLMPGSSPVAYMSCCFPRRYELMIAFVICESSRHDAERFLDYLASISVNIMSLFFLPSRSSCISCSAMPWPITLRRISSVKSLTRSHSVLVHFISYLHVSACLLDTGVKRPDGLSVSLTHVRQGYSNYYGALRSDGECVNGG